MKQQETNPDSLIENYLPADYYDSFSKELHNKNAISTDEFVDIAFNQLPSWIIRLLKVRNSIVKPFGLNTNRRITDMKCERNQHEIIFGMSDKHLTFYVSLWCKVSEANSQTLRITTIVKYHNRLGKLFFFVIRPFHKVIIRSLLERVGKRYKLISLEREAS